MFAILLSGFIFCYSIFVYIVIMPFSWARGNYGSGTAKIGVQSSWRKSWMRWLPVPTGVGITILAVFQWRNFQNKQIEDEQELQRKTVKDWEITCYRSVPLRPLSRAWGWISDRPVPISLRHWVYNKYARMYSVNLDEVENELISYSSLAEFFSRKLKEGVRPIDFSQCIVSPADGKVLNLGEVTSCQIEQVKGVTYSLQTFLGDLDWKKSSYTQMNYLRLKDDLKNEVNSLENVNSNAANNEDSIIIRNKSNCDNNHNDHEFNLNIKQITSSNRLGHLPWSDYKKLLLKNPDENELYQFVVYLAPGDYHRFHSPVHWNIHYRRHFQGELLSVNPRIASWVPELFSLNERVIYYGEWEHGFFSMAAVGATNVGSIRVHSDETLHTNGRKWAHGIKYKDKKFDMVWEKGQEVGEFRMGSTIVILFEAPKDYKFNIDPNQRVKVGEAVTCPFDCQNNDNKG